VVRAIEHLEKYYTAQEISFGVAYKWSPECVGIECECGLRTTLTVSRVVCSGCG